MSILYVIYHKKYHAIKVGIGDITGKRFRQHKNKGWELVAYWYFQDRRVCVKVESKILSVLRNRYGHYLNKEDMPQSGYTETFDANKISKKTLIKIIKKFI